MYRRHRHKLWNLTTLQHWYFLCQEGKVRIVTEVKMARYFYHIQMLFSVFSCNILLAQ